MNAVSFPTDHLDDRGEVLIQPHNLDAEQELLGAIFINNEAASKVSSFLRPEHFFHEAHRRIFGATLTLIERGEIANPVTLKAYFANDEVLAKVGGPAYLARLAAAATTVINAGDYGQVIFDLAMRRELIALGEMMIAVAADPKVEEGAAQMLRRFHASLEGALATSDVSDIPVYTLGEFSMRAYDRIGEVAKGGHHGIRTGISDLDAKFGGFDKGHLDIVAGRPSMGKTALVFQMVKNAAKLDGKKVLIFEHEMSGEELAERSLAEHSGEAYSDMRTAKAAQLNFNKLLLASREDGKLPIFICDRPSLTVADMRRVARRERRRRGGLDMIVVDHLGLVRPSQNYRNRVDAITEVTLQLKGLAKELDVPVIALSQLSRKVEDRDDKRPELSDLRDSGSIEQDADAVIFVYRDDYYHLRKRPKPGTPEHDTWGEQLDKIQGVCEVIIAKQRQGPVDKALVFYHPPTNRFTDLSRKDEMRQTKMGFDWNDGAKVPGLPAEATNFAPLE